MSRTVVREAVRILQEKDLAQVRQGSGTIVQPPTAWNMLDELVLSATIAEDDRLAILDDLVVTRRLLESDMANVAARLAAPDVIEQLGALVARMDELVEADRKVHRRSVSDPPHRPRPHHLTTPIVRTNLLGMA